MTRQRPASGRWSEPELAATAEALRRQGVQCIPIPIRNDGTRNDGKNPDYLGWRVPAVDEDVAARFNLRNLRSSRPHAFRGAHSLNMGVLTGAPSGNLVCVDLDDLTAVRAAQHVLPLTPLKFGRPSTGVDHYFYRANIKKKLSFDHPEPAAADKARIIELLTTGQQVVVPYSLHVQCGEYRAWDGFEGLVELQERVQSLQVCPPDELVARIRLVAAITMAMTYYTPGRRHDFTLGVAGLLAHSDYPQRSAEAFIEALVKTAEDDEPADRLAAVTSTYAQASERQPYTGRPALVEMTSSKWVSGFSKAIGLSRRQCQDRAPRGHATAYITAAPAVCGEPLIDTDASNSRRLARMLAGKTKYIADQGAWLTWDGKRWSPVPVAQLERAAKQVARVVLHEASCCDSDDRRATLRKHARYCESRGAIKNMVELLKSEDGILVQPNQLDQDLNLLNLNNGTLDLSSYSLLPHDPKHLITRLAPVDYEPTAQTPEYDAFINRILGSNRELVDYLHRYLGSALIGDISDQVFLVLCGDGANGKSTLAGLVSRLFGDYAAFVSPDAFQRPRFEAPDAPRPQLAALEGVRLVCGMETRTGFTLDDGLIKQITGGEPLTTRKLYGNPVTFPPRFKVIWGFNHRPVITDTSGAMWRRLKLIEMLVSLPESEWNRRLCEELFCHEASGILNVLLRGLRIWRRCGLAEPICVRRSTAAYRSDLDTVLGFIEERCERDCMYAVEFKVLHDAYVAWCTEQDAEPVAKQGFARRLEALGFKGVSAAGNVKTRKGLRLRLGGD